MIHPKSLNRPGHAIPTPLGIVTAELARRGASPWCSSVQYTWLVHRACKPAGLISTRSVRYVQICNVFIRNQNNRVRVLDIDYIYFYVSIYIYIDNCNMNKYKPQVPSTDRLYWGMFLDSLRVNISTWLFCRTKKTVLLSIILVV